MQPWKRAIGNNQVERAIDLTDKNIKDIYKVDILTAVKWVMSIWQELPGSVIRSSSGHTGLVQKISPGDMDRRERVMELEMSENLESLLPPRMRMFLQKHFKS